MLPNDFPPVSTVRGYFYTWRNDSLRDEKNRKLLQAARLTGLMAEAFGLVEPLIEQVLLSDVTNRSCLAVVVTGRSCLNPHTANLSFEDGCCLITKMEKLEQLGPRLRQMAISKAEITRFYQCGSQLRSRQ